MPSYTTIAAGINGGQCVYRPVSDRVIVARSDPSRNNDLSLETYLLRPGIRSSPLREHTVSAGSLIQFDQISTDLRWEQPQAGAAWQLRPQGGTTLCALGPGELSAVLPESLRGLSYSAAPLTRQADGTGTLANGSRFVANPGGAGRQFAVAQVIGVSGQSLSLRSCTYTLVSALNAPGSSYQGPFALSGDDAVFLFNANRMLTRVSLQENKAETLLGSSSSAYGIVFDQVNGQLWLSTQFSSELARLSVLRPGAAEPEVVLELGWSLSHMTLARDGRAVYAIARRIIRPGSSSNVAPSHRIVRVDLEQKRVQILAEERPNPTALCWADEEESALLVAESFTLNRIVRLDLTRDPGQITTVAQLPFPILGLAAISPTRVIACGRDLVEVGLDPPDEPEAEIPVLRRRIELAQSDLAEAEQRAFALQQQLALTQRERERQRQRIAELERQSAELKARVEQFRAGLLTDPESLGKAVGATVDVLQQGLTALANPYVDYGVQEFELQAPASLQVGDDGRLQLRLPAPGEQIAPESLGQIQILLRPIPKGAAAEEAAP